MACSYHDLELSVESHNLQLYPGFDHVLNFKIAVQGSAQKAISSNINISTDTAHAGVLGRIAKDNRFNINILFFQLCMCVGGRGGI